MNIVLALNFSLCTRKLNQLLKYLWYICHPAMTGTTRGVHS